MTCKISAVILDLGEVLIRLDFKRVLEALGATPKECLASSLADSLQKLDKWDAYDQFERGRVTENAFFLEAPRLRAVWHTVLHEPVPHVEEILTEIKHTTRLFALTNTNSTHIQFAKSQFPFLRHFEKIFTSFEIGARKPETEIYQFTDRAIGIQPNRILFLDDRLENVEGARKVGWNAELCRSSPRDLAFYLRRYGVGSFPFLPQDLL